MDFELRCCAARWLRPESTVFDRGRYGRKATARIADAGGFADQQPQCASGDRPQVRQVGRCNVSMSGAVAEESNERPAAYRPGEIREARWEVACGQLRLSHPKTLVYRCFGFVF